MNPSKKKVEEAPVEKPVKETRGLVENIQLVKEKIAEVKKPKDKPKPEEKVKIVPTESIGKAVLTTPRTSVQRPPTTLSFRKTQTKKTISTPYGKINLK
jgi:hypothetical protein